MFTGWLPPLSDSSPEHPSTSDQSLPSPHIIVTSTLPENHQFPRLSRQEMSPKNCHQHNYSRQKCLPYFPKLLFCRAQIFLGLKSLWERCSQLLFFILIILLLNQNRDRTLFDNVVLTDADLDDNVSLWADWARLCVTWWRPRRRHWSSAWRRTFAGFAPLTRPPYTHSRPIMPPYNTRQ